MGRSLRESLQGNHLCLELVDDRGDADEVGVGLGAVAGLLVGDGDHCALSFQLAVVPSVFGWAAEPAGEEFVEVALRGSADAELKGLNLVGATVLAFEAEQEAGDVEQLLLLRILELRALDAELVLDVQAGGDVGAREGEGSDVKTGCFWLV
ncbi:MAG TPA: hypothetical protein DCX06_11590 [Opitutae bacterium]|nr:hypothetical protein [Opitutae bacterium]